uniref:Uncharacterized protein n=1 Tax=uncultured bacterium contig00064 TaxID=1181547 RepID=A0A806JZK4_9BACT|nr:hypothetical protein [uncultured bacterium contig00064]
MKRSSGRVKSLKFAANSGPANIWGKKAMINIIINIIILKAIMRYLNFIGGIIKERFYCVYIAGSLGDRK